MSIPKAILMRKLLEFLEEDVGFGDLTTEAVVPEGLKVEACIVVKENCVVAGLSEVGVLFESVGVEFTGLVGDGEEVKAGSIIANMIGEGRSILTVERTALNLIGRMCGIATATRRLVRMAEQYGAGRIRIAATRKTAPGLRYFDKRAVLIGGGDTHRFRLDDAVLIKDNHITIAGGVAKAVERVIKRLSFSKKVEVEVRRPEEALEAVRLGVDIIMLDNMSLDDVKRTLSLLEEEGLRENVIVEVSGGITEENIEDLIKLQPDVISLGYLTHSVRAVDVSLDVVRVL